MAVKKIDIGLILDFFLIVNPSFPVKVESTYSLVTICRLVLIDEN